MRACCRVTSCMARCMCCCQMCISVALHTLQSRVCVCKMRLRRHTQRSINKGRWARPAFPTIPVLPPVSAGRLGGRDVQVVLMPYTYLCSTRSLGRGRPTRTPKTFNLRSEPRFPVACVLVSWMAHPPLPRNKTQTYRQRGAHSIIRGSRGSENAPWTEFLCDYRIGNRRGDLFLKRLRTCRFSSP